MINENDSYDNNDNDEDAYDDNGDDDDELVFVGSRQDNDDGLYKTISDIATSMLFSFLLAPACPASKLETQHIRERQGAPSKHSNK